MLSIYMTAYNNDNGTNLLFHPSVVGMLQAGWVLIMYSFVTSI